MATPALKAILAYAFFGLDALGEDVESRPSAGQRTLAVEAIVRATEITPGEAALPDALQPQEFVVP